MSHEYDPDFVNFMVGELCAAAGFISADSATKTWSLELEDLDLDEEILNRVTKAPVATQKEAVALVVQSLYQEWELSQPPRHN